MPKTTVIYTNYGGPYTLHAFGKLLIPISHSSGAVPELFIGNTEQEVITKIQASKPRIAVHTVSYPDRATALKAIIGYIEDF
jgi:hypothetical protein